MKVSVVITTYNRAHFVCEAIDSVLAQTFKDFEIIVIDDGSIDNTPQVLGKYGSRIRYIYQKHQGLSVARNTGIRSTRTEYIAFLDDDDIWLPHKLERQVIFLDSHSDIGLVHSSIEVVNSQGYLLKEATQRHLRLYRKASKVGYTYEGLSRCGIMFLSSVMLRKICLKEVDLFDPKTERNEDWDFALRFALRYRIAILPEPLVRYRLHYVQTPFDRLTKGRIKVAMKHLSMLNHLDNIAPVEKIRYNFYLHLADAYYINMELLLFRKYFLKALKLNMLALFKEHLVLHFLMSFIPVRIMHLIRRLRTSSRTYV
jgi:glycosyltransferase involved in cell wall biosynthesis